MPLYSSLKARVLELPTPEGPVAANKGGVSRRGLAALVAAGYAAYAVSADAEPVTTSAAGLIVGDVRALEAGGPPLPAYVARPAAPGRYPAVVVVSEVFGLHEYIRDICRRFAQLGYVAIAPAFFFRADPGNALPRTTDFAEIQRVVSTAHNEQVMGDVGATLAWLKAQPFVDSGRLALTGFCWGGTVAWMAASRFPELKATASWYGRVVRPDSGFMSDDVRPWPIDLAARTSVPVLGLYGGQDKGITEDSLVAMRKALVSAGRGDDVVVVYPDAEHGFHADYRASYNPAAAHDGWERMLGHFRRHGATPGAA